MIVDAILARMQADEVYEVSPLTGVFPAADVPLGYCGTAYYRDDPRLRVELEQLEAAGWTLPIPHQDRGY